MVRDSEIAIGIGSIDPFLIKWQLEESVPGLSQWIVNIHIDILLESPVLYIASSFFAALDAACAYLNSRESQVKFRRFSGKVHLRQNKWENQGDSSGGTKGGRERETPDEPGTSALSLITFLIGLLMISK